MLSGLLDLSKLDSGSYQVRLEHVRLRDIVEEVLGLFEEKAHRKGLTLSLTVAVERRPSRCGTLPAATT